MFFAGLASLSFRGESAESVIELAKANALDGIEWGGDIHVPVGDVERAIEVGEKTREAGLAVFSYGSYYRLGEAENPRREFGRVLETAAAGETGCFLEF